MPLARWKSLCMDAADAPSLAAFWAGVFGRDLVDVGDGSARIDGSRPAESIWVDPVPEPKKVKHRVHLDVRVGDLADLEGLGARVLREPGDDRSWWVMADPEGGEFCAFLRDDRPSLPGELFELVVDARDPLAQAQWWADLLGGQGRTEEPHPWAWVEGMDGTPFAELVFTPVPEGKVGKNRVHWDVDAPAVAPIVAQGASVLRAPDDDVTWHVLADPEGNEFCVFTPTGRSTA